MCPCCRTPLRPLEFSGVQLEECADCGGVWFDDGELNAVRDSGVEGYETLEVQASPGAQHVPSEGAKLCPSCNLRLRTYRYLYTSPIELEECPGCYGVWVEEGELGKIHAFLQQQPVGSGGRDALDNLDTAGATRRFRMRSIARAAQAISARSAPFASSS
jgi:Zn-finger nucleic acid-binding protein